ncbi:MULTISPECIES: hypothetical protein [Burkholderia]|uniref:hypothetical protein n=1 Tax=Burkholderia TaxID=32008 RepID=UPI0007550626|nr:MULTISPECIES: hypothetical protein [Burkholderia]AOJ73551.1 hypothetical protein WS78_32475 [Burkholderia savannae]KVG38906.1 hypothetical protein WS77_20330 [Burkholderia sp. MSMB0265]KVG81632.1 hypothetical protein WS81_02080 [Burkholderia sp. MSMB2040]KVG98789.1 hypothetical protein WS83_27645 [Burkholderia sp. MSMB2042]KVG98970.1 hypothetical protein WS82_25530 [Burkholderia sp. MSMB2041]
MTPLQAATSTEAMYRSSGDDTQQSPKSIEDMMKEWIINDFTQKVMFPDPEDPSACPTFNGNGNW